MIYSIFSNWDHFGPNKPRHRNGINNSTFIFRQATIAPSTVAILSTELCFKKRQVGKQGCRLSDSARNFWFKYNVQTIDAGYNCRSDQMARPGEVENSTCKYATKLSRRLWWNRQQAKTIRCNIFNAWKVWEIWIFVTSWKHAMVYENRWRYTKGWQWPMYWRKKRKENQDSPRG